MTKPSPSLDLEGARERVDTSCSRDFNHHLEDGIEVFEICGSDASRCPECADYLARVNMRAGIEDLLVANPEGVPWPLGIDPAAVLSLLNDNERLRAERDGKEQDFQDACNELARIQQLPEQEWVNVGAVVLQVLARAARAGYPVKESDAVGAIDRGKVYVARLRDRAEQAEARLLALEEAAREATVSARRAGVLYTPELAALHSLLSPKEKT